MGHGHCNVSYFVSLLLNLAPLLGRGPARGPAQLLLGAGASRSCLVVLACHSWVESWRMLQWCCCRRVALLCCCCYLCKAVQFLQVALVSHDFLMDLRQPSCCALTNGQLPWPSICISVWHQTQRKLCLYHPQGVAVVDGTVGADAGSVCSLC